MAIEAKKDVKVIAAQPKRGINIWTILPFAVFMVVYLFLPRYIQDKQLTTLIYIGINVMLALGLNLLMGYAGQISLGHAAFFGLGAYTSAIMTLQPIKAEIIPGFSTAIGVMVGCAVVVSLCRINGWKLAASIAALIILSIITKHVHSFALGLIIYTAGMALWGLLLRLGWLRVGAAGVATVAAKVLCQSVLFKILASNGASPWAGMLIGVVITCLIAYLVGCQVLRLKGHYLAMATLGFGIIIEIVFRQWTDVTGGSSDGIFGIPSITYLNSLPRFARGILKFVSGGHIGDLQQYYYLVWAFVFVALVLAVNIVQSRIGRAFKAVHGSEKAAESLGVDTDRYKVQVFVLSAGLASIAGSLHAHMAGVGYINPGEFGFMVSVQLMAMVVIGGMASVWGALFGATAIEFIKDWMLDISKLDTHLFGLTLRGLDPIVFGAILIFVMIVVPQGLVRGITDLLAAAVRPLKRTPKRSEK